jgi:hypothetical protein
MSATCRFEGGPGSGADIDSGVRAHSAGSRQRSHTGSELAHQTPPDDYALADTTQTGWTRNPLRRALWPGPVHRIGSDQVITQDAMHHSVDAQRAA